MDSPVEKARNSPSAPRVCIVTLNWNGWRDTLECLRSARKLTEYGFIIVVVDNGSVGDDVSILRREAADYCHIIENDRNYGFAEGNNVGMRWALQRGADFVLLVNNDAVVETEDVLQLVQRASLDRSIGLASPKVYAYDDPFRLTYPRIVHEWSPMWLFHIGSMGFLNFWYDRRTGGVRDVSIIDGMCMLIRREVLTQCGLFDPIYFFGGMEGFELSYRARRAGFRQVVVRDLAIRHKGSRSLGTRKQASFFLAYWYVRGRVIFAREKLNLLHQWLFLLLLPFHILFWVAGFGGHIRSLSVLTAIGRGLWDGLWARDRTPWAKAEDARS